MFFSEINNCIEILSRNDSLISIILNLLEKKLASLPLGIENKAELIIPDLNRIVKRLCKFSKAAIDMENVTESIISELQSVNPDNILIDGIFIKDALGPILSVEPDQPIENIPPPRRVRVRQPPLFPRIRYPGPGPQPTVEKADAEGNGVDIISTSTPVSTPHLPSTSTPEFERGRTSFRKRKKKKRDLLEITGDIKQLTDRLNTDSDDEVDAFGRSIALDIKNLNQRFRPNWKYKELLASIGSMT
ncbi:hypothetical protein HNY73_007428 [Argiope bruennichi]|uniref:Uncharacterized protein n=1 Tax=Argiope bruennichi TaxID=94029 RepID=A0A8T0FGH1_ARGBR|nr:hypothetical protein HNY73_007428 [Argiope bruennichi]